MSNFSNLSYENEIYGAILIGVSGRAGFWLYLISDILSIFCSLVILYFIVFNRILRQALHNHIIIVLLIIGLINELIGVPWNLHYLRTGVPVTDTFFFYLLNFFFEYGIYTTQIILFAWATIERHILIFHHQWILTRKNRFFIHYLPIIIILIYCFIYYSIITFSPFCKNSFDVFISGGIFIPCVYKTRILGEWDLIVHHMIPTLIIVISSITLIERVLRQKRKINQRIQWRKHRKMTIQLLLISALYLIFNFPWTILLLMLRYQFIQNSANLPMLYSIFVRPYVIFLFPFICCGALSEIRSKFNETFLCRRQLQQTVPLIPLKVIFKSNELRIGIEHMSD